MKKPKWLRWESSETKSDNLKKARQRTDQRMKHRDTQKELRDEAEEKSAAKAAEYSKRELS